MNTKTIDYVVIGMLAFLLGYLAMGRLFAMKRVPRWYEADWKRARMVVKIMEEKLKVRWTKVGPGIMVSDRGDIWIDTSEPEEQFEIDLATSIHEKREIVGAPEKGRDVPNPGNGSTFK